MIVVSQFIPNLFLTSVLFASSKCLALSNLCIKEKQGKMCVLDSSHVASLLISFYKKKDDLDLREIGGGGGLTEED